MTHIQIIIIEETIIKPKPSFIYINDTYQQIYKENNQTFVQVILF